MFAFRFRIRFENNDSFLREVVFSSNQNFEDFHNFIVENLKLDKTKSAAFFLSNYKFRKQKQIIMDRPESTNNQESEEIVDDEISEDSVADDQNEENNRQALIMRDHRLSDLIDDPHQRLVYVYDFQNNWTFYIELLKIIPAEPQVSYPEIIKQSGGIPQEFLPKKVDSINSEDNPDKDQEGGSEGDSYDDTKGLNIKYDNDDDLNITDDNSNEQFEPDDDQ